MKLLLLAVAEAQILASDNTRTWQCQQFRQSSPVVLLDLSVSYTVYTVLNASRYS